VIDHPWSPFAQAMFGLAQVVTGAGVRVLAITSPDPRVGQYNVAAALARTLSLLGWRVVLVDMHPPTAGGILGAKPAGASLKEVLAGTAPLSGAFAKDPRSSLLVLGAEADALIPRLAEFITHLRTTCDFVIVDGPPIRTGGMSSLARFMQALLVVTQKNTMDWAAEGAAALNVPLAGCVLTV